jgi:hypothetical protein
MNKRFDLQDGLQGDILNPRNGLIMCNKIEEAFDVKRVCFVYDFTEQVRSPSPLPHFLNLYSVEDFEIQSPGSRFVG